MERIGNEFEIFIGEHHVVVEDGLLRIGVVFSPIAFQHAGTVDEPAALKVIAHVVEAVVVEAVGLQHLLAVGHDYVVAHFGHQVLTVIMQHVAGEFQGVALHDAHVSEGVERLRGFVEQGAVAVHGHAAVTKHNVAAQPLRRVGLKLIEAVIIGFPVYFILFFLHGLLALVVHTLPRPRGEAAAKQQEEGKEG